MGQEQTSKSGGRLADVLAAAAPDAPHAGPPPLPGGAPVRRLDAAALTSQPVSDPPASPPVTGAAPVAAEPAALAIPAPTDPGSPEPAETVGADGDAPGRRKAKRRPAGPARDRLAANDDAPSIGGLIYALNQKPSNKPFVGAAAATGLWLALGLGFGWVMLAPELSRGASLAEIMASGNLLTALATLLVPIAVFWFLAVLVWRSEELKLRSSAMTEVAVRLAEPDRLAEQHVASLGQAVRRQVSFMNEAVERALGRAGELEALVHNEVSALDRSYEENERKIRGLIQELAGERNALASTSENIHETLRVVASEVPALLDKLTQQQLKLAGIIDGAGQNLTSLETALATQTGNLENALGSRTTQLQSLLEDYTGALGHALGARSEQLHEMLQSHLTAVGDTMEGATRNVHALLESGTETVHTAIGERTQGLQIVFEEYAKALDSTLANRAQALDMQLVERTRALDDAFSERLRLFDESILRSTMAIDGALGENARALTSAMATHAREMSETIGKQAVELDETIMSGITAVRRTSENITRQSLKAIEGLAGQADLLKNVSENLLGQINSVTGRFETQGQVIMRAANALETANYKIDSTLQARQNELAGTLDRLAGKADEFGRAIQGYSSTIEGSLTEAEMRARRAAEELARSADLNSRSTIAEVERLRLAASSHTDTALEDLRNKFSTVSREVTQRLGTLSSQFDQTSSELRDRAARAASELETEQARLRQQMDSLPTASRESTEAMRRALSDQLRALEQLSSLTTREAHRRDVAPPAPIGLPAPAAPARPVSSLTSTLANELAQRQRQTAPAAPPPVAPPAQQTPPPAAQPDGRGGWSLGDLLTRASRDEEQQHGAAPQSRPAAAPPSPAGNPTLDIEAIGRALDPHTANAIWNRFRLGQRGFMVRSIYAEAGKATFDEVERRYRTEPLFRDTVNRFLLDFEAILRQTEARDQTGQAVQAQLVSDMGRVYLMLAHVSGRLA